jgi:hypothetical protein
VQARLPSALVVDRLPLVSFAARLGAEALVWQTRAARSTPSLAKLAYEGGNTLDQISIVVAPQDLERIREIDVIPQGNIDQLDKITVLANKTSASQSYFRIEEPTTEFGVILDIVVTRKQSAEPTQVRLYITYRYIDRDWLWETRQWIFRNLNW